MKDSKCGSRLGVSFGVQGLTLVPDKVTSLLGVFSTNQFAEGDLFETRTGQKRRPFGVWSFDSESFVESEDLEDHALFILERLEPQKNMIQKMIADPSLRVSIAIWWEPEGGQGGFTMNAGTLNRLASLANEVDFYFA